MEERKKSGCENRTLVNLGFIIKKDGCSSIELFHSDLCGLDDELRRERKWTNTTSGEGKGRGKEWEEEKRNNRGSMERMGMDGRGKAIRGWVSGDEGDGRKWSISKELTSWLEWGIVSAFLFSAFYDGWSHFLLALNVRISKRRNWGSFHIVQRESIVASFLLYSNEYEGGWKEHYSFLPNTFPLFRSLSL